MLSVPLKWFLAVLELHHDKWSSGLPLLYIYVLGIAYYSVKFVRKRAEQEDAGIAIKSRALDEFMGHFCYVVRFKIAIVIGALLYWIFQIEEFLESNEVGWAFMTFYYVVMVYFLVGCCRIFRINDF